MLLLRTPERKRAAAHPAHSRLFAAAPGCGDGGSKSLRNLSVSRDAPSALHHTRRRKGGSPRASRARDGCFLEAPDKGAAVGMAELVGGDVRREPRFGRS